MDDNAADAPIRAALARDDPAAVELIWDRYAADLLAFLAARLCCRDAAEDVLQALFVTIVRKRQTVARARCLTAYLYRMARHEAATYLRRRRRRDAADAKPWLVPRETGDQPYDLAEQLQVTLGHLPRAQREVVVLKVYREKTFGEIAKLLGVSLNTTASRYRYGMERLRKLLKDSAS
ncbi:MAG: RNA polymerase sigma factor [Phycisphaerales bacterium]|nr:MAG: RNA polymerase sigma factor [Phycisphaerales bacterium]